MKTPFLSRLLACAALLAVCAAVVSAQGEEDVDDEDAVYGTSKYISPSNDTQRYYIFDARGNPVEKVEAKQAEKRDKKRKAKKKLSRKPGKRRPPAASSKKSRKSAEAAEEAPEEEPVAEAEEGESAEEAINQEASGGEASGKAKVAGGRKRRAFRKGSLPAGGVKSFSGGGKAEGEEGKGDGKEDGKGGGKGGGPPGGAPPGMPPGMAGMIPNMPQGGGSGGNPTE